ncbi:sulfite exporter taue/safe [Lucifera butyrica]|uniref:Probable membrane transporter protein n=1 Tax=Lucifera butyrica TaxID=1351585 RepID=A0A498R6S9_9FIRM|nr:TSUP family transporter [Lucifera butyrica]VBB05873.1 sulfite exporter taue/safe [Lucifera butyrica]
MESLTLQMTIFLLGAGFVASFIDSVAGGGGLVSLPALLLTGLPMPLALGTNKLASSMSSLTSTLSFMYSGKVKYRLVAWLFPLSFAGSVLGAYTVKQIPSEFLRPLVVVLLVAVTIYTVAKKNWGTCSTYTGITGKTAVLSGLAAAALGFYDGFFGPGTGSFLVFAFVMIGFDFVVAAGNAKVLNFASNIAAIITFVVLHSVNYQYGLVMGLGMIAGAIVGSQVAIRKGVAYVRPLFICVTAVLIGKQIWDLLS